MNIAEMVSKLATLGATPEMIAVAVEAVSSEQQATAAERRKDEERRAKRAEQKRQERGRATVARHGGDKGATVAATPKMSPTPPINSPQISEPSVPSGSAVGAEPIDEPDPRKRLRRDGCAKLQAMTGRPRDGCQALIGKWLAQANDDAVTVYALICEAEHQEAVHPVSFIVGRLKTADTGPRGGAAPRGPPPGQRMTGLAQLGQIKHFSRRSEYADGPTLDLEPQPPTDRAGRFAPDFPDKPRDDRNDEQGARRDGAGQVYDLPRPRAVG